MLPMIAPIDKSQQALVIAETLRYIRLAADLYRRNFAPVPVDFDLKGGSAGMFRIRARDARIRYNPWLFAKYFDENLLSTVPHEVAHYIVHCRYGLHRVKPHGHEWLAVMADFGADPSVTSDFDLTGIPTRAQRRFRYRCACRVHEVSTRRHNVMQRGQAHYECRLCRAPLVPADAT